MIVDTTTLYALPRNLVLAASAGTGKTHALVGVVVHLLLTDRAGGKPLDPSRIVATTFSRKAAAEIRTRVTSELERLALTPESSSYLASLHAVSALPNDELRGRARAALARLPNARFGTLHSFATGIVRAHAVELGLGPGFELASEADSRALADDAIARALEARLGTSEGVVRALADAAGGVDRLVTQLRRILGQLEEDGRAARDLDIPRGDVEAIERVFGELVGHAHALSSTPKFDEAATALLGAWQRKDDAALEDAAGDLCGIAARGKKTPEVESFAVYRATLSGTTNEERGRKLARLYRIRHRFGEHARFVRDVLGTAELEIERASRANATIGFGEILRAARELLRDRPDVAEEISGGIDALLVDEFQDTSRVQRDLLQLLWARQGTREAGRIPPLSAIRTQGLLVVGDRKQSIYGFRGADVGVFAELAVGLAGTPAREALGIPAGVTWEPKEPLADFCALRHNRRSVPEILAFANVFSKKRFRPGDPPPELFEIDYVPGTEDLLVPPEHEEPTPPLAPRTTWLRVVPKGNKSTRLEEALVIAERIRGLVAPGGPAYRDMAVLATSNAMLDAVAFALAQSGIPHVVAGKSFFRTREVRDLAAMLALVLDPTDKLAMLEVLRGPWTGVHDETLLGLSRPYGGLASLGEWTSPPEPSLVHEEDREALAETAALVQALSRAAGRLGPGAILREAVAARALGEVLAALPRGEQRVANVQKLLAIADRHTDARAFRRWLDDASDQELSESEAATFSEADDAVRLLTIHASKGLDFPIVFVPEVGSAPPRPIGGAARISLGAGDAPNLLAVRTTDDTGFVLESPSFTRVAALGARRERAERQRLAYVAITRAEHDMYLVGGRTNEGAGDRGATTLAALEEIAEDDTLRQRAALAIEDVLVPPPTVRRPEEHVEHTNKLAEIAPRRAPAWRSLPIAPTALADFDHCARRFELVHLLGLPEHVRGTRSAATEPGAATGQLDARAQGTLAHAVLERVPTAAFATEDAEAAASRALVAEGVGVDHAQHAAIVSRVTRFLGGRYAQAIAAAGADLRREVAFVLPVEDSQGRAVVLRGSMDLVVVWPDGTVDVVDYKSAKSGAPDAYAFQLDVYALAARSLFQDAPRLRVGLVYLGGAAAAHEPKWRTIGDPSAVRASLAALGERLVNARWTDAFPRVALERCESIYCGFIGRCHASLTSAVAPAGEKGTDANPSRATTT